jgi:AcrR family transcriptional regulator
MTGDDRRAQILAVGREVFAERGFHAAGTAEIAARAGCSEPTIYKYFPSKQALFAAVLEDATARTREHIEQIIGDADDPIQAIVESGCGSHAVVAQTWRLRMLAITLLDDPQIREAIAQSVTVLRDRFSNAVSTSQQRGVYRSDVDPDQLAWMWLGITFAMGYRRAVEEDVPADRIADLARTFVRVLRTAPEEASW